MEFTKTEWEIISHRLDVPCAIIDVLEYEYDLNPVDIEKGVNYLEGKGRQVGELDALSLLILQDCCEGSTYFANLEDAAQLGDVSRGWLLSMHRAANRLEKKLDVVIPRY